ncbi:MAG: DNA ligase (NAD+) [Rhodothermales bacterium]|jgi:DNA ligase (NAD+)
MSRISELRSIILKAKQAYYYGSEAIMSDAAYDSLEEELRILDPNDDVLKSVGVPVPADSILTKAQHSIPMGSQSKVNSPEEFTTWYEKSAADGKILAALKADGASAAAYYANGRLTQAISRGDGFTGEDITANAIRYQGLPAYVADENGPFSGAVRFEVVLTVENWAKIDPSMAKNPRNLGTGIMGRKNGHQSEMLTVYVFDISELRNGEPIDFLTEAAKSARAEELGFNLIPQELCETEEQAASYFDRITAERDALPFWIDGVVMKIDDIPQQLGLGTTSNRPKGQIAWKFESVGQETILRSYSISGGHTGALVPNAQLEPVGIGGTTVSNALLNNWEEIERLNVAVGDTVFLIKANDIIPKIIDVRKRPADRQLIPEPSECPFCKADVARRRNTAGEEGAVTVCLNAECPKKSIGKIKRWIKSLDILGIGDSVLEAMVEQLDLASAADLYALHTRVQELIGLIINTDKGIRLGEKRTVTILDNIDAKRALSLTEFLGSLGLEKLGKRRCEIMIKGAGGALNTLASWRSGILRTAEVAEAAGVPSIGDGIQESIDDASELIDGLLANGVTVTDVAESASDEADAEPRKTVCITGSLPSGKKKKDYADALAATGFDLVDAVSRTLDYLCLADPNSSSSKAKKARSYGTALISEEEMQALIDG